MRRALRAVVRVIGRLLAVALLVGAVAAGVTVWRGYEMYHDALEANGIAEVVEELRQQPGYTSSEQLPGYYLNAVVAIEDHRFYDHGGIDVISICRAAWHDLTTLSLEQGGSTITQQLAKNLLFSQERDFARKVAEVFAAFDLEREYSKAQILELYVNSCYFGDGLTGIGQAAPAYLGKPPSEMTDDECALMAGIPNAPSVLSYDYEAALARQRLVQAQMEKYGLA